MRYTNEFFVFGNTTPNDEFVRLIDSFTKENVVFQKVTIWADGNSLAANDPKVLQHDVLASDALENLIEINADIIRSATIKDNTYVYNQPKVEFTPAAGFLADPSNKAKNVLSLVSTPVPSISGGTSVLINPVLSDSHKRGERCIRFSLLILFRNFSLMLFGAGGTAAVKFKVDDITPGLFSGNSDLVSNLIIDL
ncbi:hypothetical protein [Chryseobacterium sp.]|uniref:hypothetical protein n=1 Tax=Chryseobacterium sp. TaxID=1871047 RepID=UPI0025C4C906|nr:hypothetical protein [Chryseobacterium sp.]MBV8327090.1 hypothetical protein [Chryseobacterium sp.]